MKRRFVLSALGGAALGATERLHAAVELKQHAHPYFPDSVLYAHAGKRVRFYTGRDVHLNSLTLRPDIDSPKALAAYARQFDVAPGWSFLTGMPEVIEIIRRNLGFYDTDQVADADIANHTGALRLGNVDRERRLMMPNRSAAKQVVRAIDNLS